MVSKLMGASVAAGLLLLVSSTANATVLYQSIPDLAADSHNTGACSQCSFLTTFGQVIGQAFSLKSAGVAKQLSFAVNSKDVWPTPVTVDIFRTASPTSLGTNIFHATYSSFTSDTPNGLGTDVVSVDLGALALDAGAYALFLWNPVELAMPTYTYLGAGTQLFDTTSGPGVGPSAGDVFADGQSVFDSAVQITGDGEYQPVSPSPYGPNGGEDSGGVINTRVQGGIPEPSTWMMMAVGFAGLGAILRRRSTLATRSR